MHLFVLSFGYHGKEFFMEEKRSYQFVRTLCEIGIMAALGFVLDELQSAYSRPLFAAGGSIGIAMVCVFVMGYRRGFFAALATGLIMGILDTMTGPYILPGSFGMAFLQVGLDYVLAYPLAALGCLFKPLFDKAETKNKKAGILILGCVIGGLAKYGAHALAGILFWTSDPETFAWGLSYMNPVAYALLYNGAFMLPCILLSTTLCVVMLFKAPTIYSSPDSIYRGIHKEEN